MKFVKENMTLVVVGVVILLAIASIFYPTGSLKADLQERMKQRLGTKGAIQTLSSTSVKIPGADKEYKGIPSKEMIEAKEKSIKHMKSQSDKVVEVGAKTNRVGRVNEKGVPLFMGQAQEGFLPKITGAAMAFKDRYATLIPSWQVALTGSDKVQGTPPSETEIRNAWDAMRKEEDARRPASMQAPTGADDQRRYEEYKKNAVMGRASALHMYVDAGAFQSRGWLATDSPPNEQNIFEAMVDSWLEGDVVKAIAATNEKAFKKANGTKNVGTAAVKRLMRITVGQDSQGTRLGSFDSQGVAQVAQNVIGAGGQATPPANLFYIQAAAAADQAAAAAGGAQPNTIDLEKRMMTGRASGSEYDVILMQLCLDVDPSYLNQFIDELYKQNMGYTVLNIKMKTVDPLSRSSNGWVYGDMQVVEVEILVESLMFREWMRPLMPEKVRVALGLPAEEPSKAP